MELVGQLVEGLLNLGERRALLNSQYVVGIRIVRKFEA